MKVEQEVKLDRKWNEECAGTDV